MTEIAIEWTWVQPRTWGLALLRATLEALAFFALVPAFVVVLSGFFPWVVYFRGFNALIIAWMPWVDLMAVLAVLLAVLARLLRGGTMNAIVLTLASVTLLGSVAISANLLWFAHEHNVEYSLLRALKPDVPTNRSPDTRIKFATVDGFNLSADIWQPPATAAPAASGGRTGILFIHGGGFSGGALGDRPTFFAALARDGYTVADVEYRLAPPARWDQAPADTLCALGWLEGKATSLGIDPKRIFVVGESAGGNLALMTAYGPGSGKLTSSCGNVAAAPAGVVAIAPTVDLVGLWHDRSLEIDQRRFPELYIGGTPDQYPDRYAAASPAGLIRGGLPPTLIVTGHDDRLVPLDRVTPFDAQLAAAGIDHDLIVVPYADHVFNGAGNGYGEQFLEGVVPAFIEAHT